MEPRVHRPIIQPELFLKVMTKAKTMPSLVPASKRGNYAELQVTTNFSFLEGASHPHELIIRAAELGLSAIAITDRNSLAGAVRAHLAARELGIKLIIGCHLSFEDGSP